MSFELYCSKGESTSAVGQRKSRLSIVKRSCVNETDNDKESEGKLAAFSEVIYLWKNIFLEKSMQRSCL